MSNVTVGTLSIDLVARTAAFQGDLGKAAQTARSSFSDIKNSAREASQGMDMHEAKASLALLSEQVGVHIPRHLRSFVVELPGVGRALSAAFSSVAVLALIEVVVKAYEKIAEWRKKLEEAKEAWNKVGEAGKEALHKQEEELLALKIQIDELTGHHLQAVRDKLEEIDQQTLDNILRQFDELTKKADEAYGKMMVGGFWSFLGMGNDQAVKNAQDDLDGIITKVHQLAEEGKNAEIGKLLEQSRQNVGSFKDVAFVNDEHPEVRKQALNYEYQQIVNLQKQYSNLNKERQDKRDILGLQERQKATEAARKEAEKAQKAQDELQSKAQSIMQSQKSEDQQKMDTLEAELAALREYQAAVIAKGEVNTQVNAAIIDKESQINALLKQQLELQHQLSTGLVPGGKPSDLKLPGTTAKPVYTGAADGLDLAKLKNDAQAQQDLMVKLKAQVSGVNLDYQKQIDEINLLIQLHPEFAQTGQAALKQIQDAQKGVTVNWKQFGAEVGQTISQAALMGSSWKDALKSILVQLVQVVLQMTLLKSLSKSTGGGGGGGFLGFLGGLFGGFHADGGVIPPGTVGITGEAGPELVYGGTSGVSVYPMRGGNSGNNVSVVYQIDARGADPSIINRLPLALKQTEDRAVLRAAAMQNDRARRAA